MQLFGLNKRRSNSLLLAIGQLILIAYVFQVAALDHWHTDPGADVMGLAGTSAHADLHADHCHGGPSSCADAGSGFAQFSADQAVHLPSSTPSLILEADSRVSSPRQAPIAVSPEPPRTLA